MAAEKLTALRGLMAQRGLDAYVIPSGDAHASEYVADFWRAREWVSGFSGSAGLLVVLREEAGLFTDGRYFIQAERELAGSGIDLLKVGEKNVPKYTEFLARKIPRNGKLGFDGRTLTAQEFSRIKAALKEKKISFEYGSDLVGLIWRDRPPLPTEKAFAHVLEFAGKTSAEKLADIRAKMREKKITAYLISALDSVAWLLNLRGRDISGLPVAYAFALVTETEAFVFIDAAKISDIALPDFQVRGYGELPEFLANFKTKKLYFNPATTNVLLAEAIPKKIAAPAAMKPAEEILPLLKAVKTPAELANIRNAFVKEGVAMVRTLFWLESAVRDGGVFEGDVARALQKFRGEAETYLCDSFPTISAYGANAAQAHYSCGERGAALREENFLLIDTGGQYLDGTTDTTRTICLGEPDEEMRRDFTLVLKAHIGLARAVFLSGTTGSGLDILARAPLWEAGQNYRHGTGHGVGFCLSVHEGPHNISQNHNAVAFAPGMLVTNEPAIYKENRYGIRTENVLAVAEHRQTPDGMFLKFETLTHCPIDRRAIEPKMLTETEREWLNSYHKRTRDTLSPLLNEAEREWLKNATAAV